MYNSAFVSKNQAEACRKVVTRIVRRQRPKTKFKPIGRFIYNFTHKAKNARMGRGKGPVTGAGYCTSVFNPLFLLKDVSCGRALRCGFEAQKKLRGRLCIETEINPLRIGGYASTSALDVRT
jgi:ribosomal protein L16/L10AE